ncbi:MAG TPA: PQQ-binding-like beta-propeller repeat protein, partial [Pirellulaceae bacterium]|nr:PQQ-binding-like beta-propeller repeat protein [Pirellulaceae bacterium]
MHGAVTLCGGSLAGGTAWLCGDEEARAGDWPQILGPTRDGSAVGEKLTETWPASGPKVAWKHPVQQGYAGPAVVGSRVFVFHRDGDKERLEALDLATGKPIWKTEFAANYRGGIDADRGPRCVPLVHKDAVYVYGPGGMLHAVTAADGKLRWSRDTAGDFEADDGYFGFGSTPIILGDKLVVNVGGRGGAIIAFNLADGSTAWKAAADAASYSAPTLATIAGKPSAVFVTRLKCIAVSPAGDVLFQFPFGKRGPTVNAATPLVFDDHLFLTASYGIGGQLLSLGAEAPKPVWSDDSTLSSQYATPVYYQGHLYGTHGREDTGDAAELRCIEAKSKRIVWSSPNFGVAHVIRSGDKLLLLKTTGELVLAQAAPGAYKPLATAKISNDTTRALPALSQGRLVLRTNDGRGGGGQLMTL